LLYLVPFASFLAEKVARLVLQNAASVAALLLTTDVVVTKKPKKHGGSISQRVDDCIDSSGKPARE
jgi:hypothetical protein